MTKSNIVCLISKILYPNYDPLCFLLYMYFKYYSVVKRQRKYIAETLPDNVLWDLIKNHPESNYDINNCVIVHPENLYPGDKILSIRHCTSRPLRLAIVLPEALCEKDKLYISNTYFHNHLLGTTDFQVKLAACSSMIEFAQEIELSLIVGPYEISNAIMELVLEDYFKIPKLVRKGDTISINMKCFSKAYIDYKLNLVENLYFKCNKVLFGGKEVTEEYFCVIGNTCIKQAANIQSFLPRKTAVGCRTLLGEMKPYSKVNVCPNGLDRYLELLKLAVNPFLTSRELKLRPIFLLEGQQGSGYDILINSLASYLGMHYFKTNSCDLSANVYAQSESKLHNVFFSAKMCAPCIILIQKFESFGKNAEGQYDQRLINSFISSLDNLFSNNKFPVILFCCNDSQEIPPEFKRLFLEIFYINAPTASERHEILKWLIEKNDIALRKTELVTVSNKTHGFYFEDLKALVYHAENHFRKSFTVMDEVLLDDEDFDAAIDFMQFNYNESLGAAKVPKVQWSDVGGLNDIKHQIIETINLPLRHPDMFEQSGLTRSGILLFGPPGTGKTLIAKAVATECSLCFLTVKGPELLNMYVGQSERNVREVFERARQASPCIIFFDELDSLAPNRGISGDSGGVTDRVVSQLLAEMDGLNSTGKVFIIGATNRPDLIDPALLRPGRFDKLLYVGPCIDKDSKIAVFQALTRKFKLSEEVDLNELVTKCPQNISGADFYGICSDAWTSAAKSLIEKIENGESDSDDVSDRDVTVNMEHFIHAIKNVKPSISYADLNYFEKLQKELTSKGGY